MKKVRNNNEGFSLVELIIVIAIMAILAGALAPQLIKYIDNSRKSTDVNTGQSIATAVGVALSNEAAYSDAVGGITAGGSDTFWVKDCYVATPDPFEAKVLETIGATQPKPKYRGGSGTADYSDFAIVISKDASNNVSFAIYPSTGTLPTDADDLAADMVYPTVGANYIN